MKKTTRKSIPRSRIPFDGELLQTILNKRGITQEALAERIAISRKTLNTAINDNLIRGEYLEKIASSLKCNADDLMKKVDVVEVVRCKDCEYGYSPREGVMTCLYYDFSTVGITIALWRSDNFFCSYGKKKEASK